MLTAAPPESDHATADEVPAELNAYGKLEANLLGIAVTIHRPSGRPQVMEVKIDARAEAGDIAEVTKEQVTRPCWKIDTHKIWREMDANKGDIDRALRRYAVSTPIKGEYIVPVTQAAKLLNELKNLRKERLALADKMATIWNTEILPELQTRFPQFYENQIKDRLPTPGSLRERFGVEWYCRTISLTKPEDLQLNALSQGDLEEVVRDSREMLDKMAKDSFNALIDQVYGELLDICDDVAEDGFSSGKRKSGALTEILDALERGLNFNSFGNDTLLQHIETAKGTMSRYKIEDINKSKVVQQKMKQVFGPLRQALQQHVGTSRAERDVSL